MREARGGVVDRLPEASKSAPPRLRLRLSLCSVVGARHAVAVREKEEARAPHIDQHLGGLGLALLRVFEACLPRGPCTVAHDNGLIGPFHFYV
jgi:hypothetical protein